MGHYNVSLSFTIETLLLLKGGAYGASPRATCLEQCTKTEVICRQQNSCDLWTRGLFAGKRGKFAEAMKRFAAEEPEEGTGPSPCDDCVSQPVELKGTSVNEEFIINKITQNH